MNLLNENFEFTQADVENYHSKGYVALRKLFAPDFLKYLQSRMHEDLETPTDHYQKGFDRLAYDMCTGDEQIYALLATPRFRQIMLALNKEALFFTQGVGFGMKKNVSTGFSWHIESQSFGFHRAEDFATTLWIPLHPIHKSKQRGGMRYVPRNRICGTYMYTHVDPAVFRCVQERIDNGGIDFKEYVALRDGPLNSSGMNTILEYYAEEDDFELGDAFLFDKYVIHRSVLLEEGELDFRDAFSLRFISEDSLYDLRRATDIEIPRNYYGYEGPTKFHLAICKEDGEKIVNSPFFDSDRARRRLE